MDPAVLRDDMVDGLEHARGRPLGVATAAAMRTVPREVFVGEAPYDNRPTEHRGTRVLAPGTVARIVDALEADDGDRTLLVGAGVGYTAAVLAEIVGSRRVHAVDISRDMVHEARSNLAEAGYGAVLVDRRDGADGLPEYAPFDRVLVEAAAVRPPRGLLAQLGPDGRLVMPMGTGDQTLVAVVADGPEDWTVVDEFGPVSFRPLLVEGEQTGSVVRDRTAREDAERAEQGHFARTGWEYDWVDWEERL